MLTDNKIFIQCRTDDNMEVTWSRGREHGAYPPQECGRMRHTLNPDLPQIFVAQPRTTKLSAYSNSIWNRLINSGFNAGTFSSTRMAPDPQKFLLQNRFGYYHGT